MCGIAGFFDRNRNVEPVARQRVLRSMTDAIAHRGPDDSGFFLSPEVALGHRRLSIIDVSSHGHQPMFNESGSVSIVYNGEIYNHGDLRPALETAGHVYRSHCDTETILHSYEQHGPDCVRQFRGMFSFALFDSATKTLFCARDRLGIKPFYYFFDGEVFVFGSEIKALLEHPSIPARLNEKLLPEYLSFGYVSGDETLHRGIRKLMPGHTLTLSASSFEPQIREYWQLPVSQEPNDRSDADWIRECREKLEEAIIAKSAGELLMIPMSERD